MVNATTLHVYLAIKSKDERSRMEDTLVLDGFNVGTFASATALWDRFQELPARLVITERIYADGFGGLDLARKIRGAYTLPYNYMVISSTMNNLKQINEALAVGIDDYLIRPYNPFQLRSRILVAMRWLNYIDSLYESASAKK